MIFLENLSKPLLLLHLAAAVLLIGASSHTLLLAPGLLKGNTRDVRLTAKYAALTLWSFLACFALGMIIYPAFRYYVRFMHFDKHLPRATGAFEIKEHLLSVALVLAVAHFAVARRVDVSQNPRARAFLAFAAATCWVIITYAFVAGAVLTMIKSI